MPGSFVGMLPNGPPDGRPGFGSQVSNWLGAPQSHSRMQCFCARFVSAAKTGFLKRPAKLATLATAPPASPFKKRRRCSVCSFVGHCPGAWLEEGSFIFYGIDKNSALVMSAHMRSRDASAG